MTSSHFSAIVKYWSTSGYASHAQLTTVSRNLGHFGCDPSYSFGLKLEEKIQSLAPAPGTYDIEKSDKYLDLSTEKSFGLRPEQKIKSVAPAPNAYNPDNADNPGNRDNPDNPDNLDNPDNADNPDNGYNPDYRDNPGNSDNFQVIQVTVQVVPGNDVTTPPL